MRNYTILQLMIVTTAIAAAFSFGRMLGPVYAITAFCIVFLAAPICCYITSKLASGRLFYISAHSMLAAVFLSGVVSAYTFAGLNAIPPLTFLTLLLWFPQVAILSLFSSCRDGRLWYLYWGYHCPDAATVANVEIRG